MLKIDPRSSIPDLPQFFGIMKINAAGEIEAAAERVLGVTARAAPLGEATARAYEAVGKIRFYKVQYRKELSVAR